MNTKSVARLLEQLEISSDGGYIGDPNRGLGSIIAWGNSVPADTASGYAPGCLFIHTDGGAGTDFYVNNGSKTSSDFDLVTVA